MSIVKTGTITVVTGGAAQNLNLGFVPSKFYMRNDTILVSGTVTGVVEVWYDEYTASLSTPYVVINTCTTGVPAISRLASGTLAATTGIIPFQTADSNLFVPNQAPYTTTSGNRAYIGASTNLVITGLSNAANASVTATHSFTSADVGVTVVTFHGVLGMTQINGLSGVIQTVTSTTSFTVNIDTTNFGTYSAGTAGLTGGFANVITGAPANTLYGNVSLPTAEANLGIVGLRLGTSVMVNTNDVWYYEAILNYPGIC
jgi:ubiquitin-activating enzyme E1-like protein